MVAHGLVTFGGVQVTFGGEDVIFGGEEPWDVSTVGFRILRNGAEFTDYDPDEDQLLSISLTKIAFDGQIGMGTITVNGDPGWVAGDRITLYSWSDADCIYEGYVGDRSKSGNPRRPLDVQTTYQLMDTNRRLIGIHFIDYVATGTIGVPLTTSNDIVSAFFFYTGNGTGQALFTHAEADETWVLGTGAVMPNRTYVSDGMTDAIGDIILYTGTTIFVTEKLDGEFYLHWHELDQGPDAGISISDIPLAANGTTVFAPINPEIVYSSSDLQNDILANNGVVNVVGDNATSIATHNAGGLHWQRNYQTSATQDDLETFVNGLLNTAQDERPTYRCSLGPMSGHQVTLVRQGDMIYTNTVVWGELRLRIAAVTITASKDDGGNPAGAGIWDVALELGNPIRQPAAAIGYGGQGGFSGALHDTFPESAHFQPIGGGQFVASDIPVGGTYRINFQLIDSAQNAVRVRDVQALFTLEQWEDVAETIAGDGWSVNSPLGSDLTDEFGFVYIDLTHDTAGSSIVVNVIASL